MRLFFGLSVEPERSREIARWREKSLPPFAKPVPEDNFHLTLSFLGEVNEARRIELGRSASRVRSPAFSLKFVETGLWLKQGIFYLAPETLPEVLESLVEQTRQIAMRGGLRVEKRKYFPHLTLARRCHVAPPASLMPPDFDIRFGSFALFESRNMKRGVRYEILEEYELT